MRLTLRRGAVTTMVAALALTVAMAAPAAAAHHHHHHHHHSGGSGVTCGPGTVNVGGACTPSGPGGPAGNGNVTITPSSVTLNLDGSFAFTAVITGLPPSAPLVSPNFGPLVAACPGSTASADVGEPDAQGRMQVSLTETGPCVPGTYPILFQENESPFQTFTGFITLHF